MSKIALLYGSTEGQTKKISEKIRESLIEKGHKADLFNLKSNQKQIKLNGYDGAIIGSSVHIGRHQKYVLKYIKKNIELLSRIPTAFFSVNLTAYEDKAESQEKVKGFINDFLSKTNLDPVITTAFPGALKFSQYGFIKRKFMKKITSDVLKKELGEKSSDINMDLELNKDIEFTDWGEVENFTEI